MWKPDESLDEYLVNPTPEVILEPARVVSLQRSGEVEVLKPLIRSEVRSRPARTAFKGIRPRVVPQPLWFRRFLAVGSGALVMIALVLVSAILVGINDPALGPDITTNVQPNDEPTQTQEQFSFDGSSPSVFTPATIGSELLIPTAKRRAVRPRAEQLAPYQPRRYSPHLQPAEPTFVPTTLIIYSENGMIKTRIEPWLRSS